MDAVMNTTLTKWGNSQGFRVPREACDLLGVGLGAKAKMVVDSANSQLLLTFEQPKRKFRRTRRVSIDELFEGYDGVYEPPADWPVLANEIDWGNPVGEET
jgi:antitoxin MazE